MSANVTFQEIYAQVAYKPAVCGCGAISAQPELGVIWEGHVAGVEVAFEWANGIICGFSLPDNDTVSIVEMISFVTGEVE